MARDITIRFLGDESDLTRASRNATDDLDRFSKRAGVMGGVVGAASAAAINGAIQGVQAMGRFVSGALKEAEDAQRISKVQAQLIEQTGAAAFTTAKDLDKYATSMSNKTGIDDEAIAASQNVLLTFKSVQNQTGKGNKIFDRATKAAGDLSAVLGTDLQASTLQLGKALQDPIKGTTALGRAGVQFTEEQKGMIKALVESGDVLGAQKIILGEVESQVGGAAEANATATQRMTTAWGNFKEGIGALVLPAFEGLVSFMIERVLPAFEEFTSKTMSFVKEWAGIIGDAFGAGFEGKETEDGLTGIAGAVQAVAEAAGGAFRTALDMLKEFGTWCADNRDIIDTVAAGLAGFGAALATVGAAQKAGSAVSSLGSSLMAIGAALGPWGLLAVAIIAIGAAAFMAYQKFEPFRNIVDAIWQGILTGWNAVVDFFETVIPPVIDFITNLWAQFGDEIMGILTALAEMFAAIWARILEAWNTFWAIFEPIVRTALDIIMGLWAVFGDNIIRGVQIAFDVIRTVIETVLGVIQGIIQIVTGVISGDWSKVWEGIKTIASSVWEGIRGILSSAIDWVRNIWSTLTELLIAPFRTVGDVVSSLLSGVADVISGVFEDAVGFLKDGVNEIIDILNGAIRAYNSIPLAPDIDTIPKLRSVTPPSIAIPAPHARVPLTLGPQAMTAYHPAPATFGAARVVNINLPTGVNGHDVIDAVKRYERRNGTARWVSV